MSRHIIFNIIGGASTAPYQFIKGFYELTDDPAAFQKVMDYNLFGLKNTRSFLDDTIIVSRRSHQDRQQRSSQIVVGHTHKISRNSQSSLTTSCLLLW